MKPLTQEDRQAWLELACVSTVAIMLLLLATFGHILFP